MHLVPGGTLQHTTSGKLMRSLTRQEFESGALPRIRTLDDWRQSANGRKTDASSRAT